MNAADILIDSLIECGVDVVFGMPGDGINGIMEALRTRQDRIRFVQVRHEESAAFMAVAYGKWTGRLGCCLATSGPGGVHLLNGLYDGKCDGVPVLAITGLPFHDLVDTSTQQDVELDALFADVAAYSTRVMSAAHVANALALACRTAWAQRGVAHLSIPVDIQEQEIEEAERSDRNLARHVAFGHDEGEVRPPAASLDRAAEILRAGKRVAVLAGRGALGARDELLAVAERLGAPIVKALLGKGAVPDDHAMTTGGIGLLGTRPSQEVFEECDTLLIVGSTFPYIEYYPKPGQARVIQIDVRAERIGLRAPVEVGLVGDAKATLSLLLERLPGATDRAFLQSAQARMAEWRALRERIETAPGRRMKPQILAREVGRRLAPDALIAVDSGHNTGLFARFVDLKADQKFAVSGSMASMACGVPYAIAAAIAYPGRQVVAFVGDGGLSMLLGELATITKYKLPIKIVVVKNDSLGQIKWEQMMFLGNPEFGCELEPIDFVGVARAMGIAGLAIKTAEECEEVLDRAFAMPGAVLVEGWVDPHEPLLPAKRKPKFADNLRIALDKGTAGAEEIARNLTEEPAKTFLRP